MALLTDAGDVWHIEFSQLCFYLAHALLLEEALPASIISQLA